jgi:GNAT superfamily N-acetyltransferase
MTLFDFRARESGLQACSPATELQSNDLEELATFLISEFGCEKAMWQEWFAHWWAANPARHSSIPRGWVIHSGSGNLVAFAANIPLRYVIDGRPGLCCATGSVAVHPNWRGRGLAKAIGQRFLDQANGDLLVGADSTDAAYGLWRSLGMESLEEPWLKTNSRILGHGPALGAAISRYAGLPAVFGRAAGGCIALWLAFPFGAIRRSESLSVAKTEWFAEEDSHSIECCRASAASTYAWRDVATLNWLYFGSRYLRQTRAVFIARSGSQLVGYLAMKQWRSHSYFLLECRCLNADLDIARELFRHARQFAMRNRALSIVVRPYTRMIEAAVPRAVSVKLSRPVTTYCYKFRGHDIDKSRWEATPGDGDLSLN